MPANNPIPDDLKPVVIEAEVTKFIDATIKSYPSYQQLKTAFSTPSFHCEMIESIEDICKKGVDQYVTNELESLFFLLIKQQNAEDLLFISEMNKKHIGEDQLKQEVDNYSLLRQRQKETIDNLNRRIHDIERASLRATNYYNNSAATEAEISQNDSDIVKYKNKIRELEQQIETIESKESEAKYNLKFYIQAQQRINYAKSDPIRYSGAQFLAGEPSSNPANLANYKKIPDNLSFYLSGVNIVSFENKKYELTQAGLETIQTLNVHFEKKYVDMTVNLLTLYIAQTYPTEQYTAFISAMKCCAQQAIQERNIGSLNTKLETLQKQQTVLETDIANRKTAYKRVPSLEQQENRLSNKVNGFGKWSTYTFYSAAIFGIASLILIVVSLSNVTLILSVGLVGLATMPIAFGLFKLHGYLSKKESQYRKDLSGVTAEKNTIVREHDCCNGLEIKLQANRQEQLQTKKTIAHIQSGLTQNNDNNVGQNNQLDEPEEKNVTCSPRSMTV